jgi:hypothetical protein
MAGSIRSWGQALYCDHGVTLRNSVIHLKSGITPYTQLSKPNNKSKTLHETTTEC